MHRQLTVTTFSCQPRGTSLLPAAWGLACVCLAIGLWQSPAPAAEQASPSVSASNVPWAGQGAYRILVTVAPRDLAGRSSDEMPARLRIDLAQVLKQWGVDGRPDLGRIQVIRYDARTGAPAKCPTFRGQGPYDIPYRFDDFDRREYSFWYDVEGNGHAGQVVWTHSQQGALPASYAIYFDTVKPGGRSTESPLPLLGDGDALMTDQSDGFLITALHRKPTMCDWNGDGLLDLLVGETPGHIFYFENVSTRTHPELKERPFPFARPCHVGDVAVPCAADWNGDGLLDLVIGDYNHVRLYRNVGSRTRPLFELAETLKNQWGPVHTGAFSTSPVDWDGDGKIDLVYSGGGVAWMRNADPRNPPRWERAGALTAAGKPINHIFPIGDSELFPLVADFNGDGLPDLILGVADGYVWYYKNIGTRTQPKLAEGVRFRLRSGGLVKVGRYREGDAAVDFASHSGDRSCPKIADFNGDGRMDLMVSDAYGDVTYFENVGTNNDPLFAPGIKVLHEGNERAMIGVTDWDHDGRVDIILGQEGRVCLYRNVGTGRQPRFERDRELIHQYIPYPHPYVVDWNRDGDKDLFISSSYGVSYLFERSYLEKGYAEAVLLAVQCRPQ